MHLEVRSRAVSILGTSSGRFQRVALACAAAVVLLAPGKQGHAASAPEAAPCTDAIPACVQWVVFGKGPARSMVYSSYPLAAHNTKIHRALILVHGMGRNADHSFRTEIAAAILAGALEDTIVIAPNFLSADHGCDDKLQANEVSWTCRGDSWRSGGNSPSNPELRSFDFVDELLRKLADKKVFPNLTEITVAGHSAGGQFVARYEMVNRVADSLGVKVNYVVANPSSYAWPDATRPLPVDDAAPPNAGVAWQIEEPHTNFSYGPFDASKEPKYDLWPFGLEQRTSGYTMGMTDEQLKKQLVERLAATTFLVGQVDVLPLGGFDSSPSAMAQGATRRARGEAYVKYVNETLGAHGKLLVIPGCGHNERCVYTTDKTLPVIFPAP